MERNDGWGYNFSLVVKNILPLILITSSICLMIYAEDITQDKQRINVIDNFAQSLLFGSGVMIKGREDG